MHGVGKLPRDRGRHHEAHPADRHPYRPASDSHHVSPYRDLRVLRGDGWHSRGRCRSDAERVYEGDPVRACTRCGKDVWSESAYCPYCGPNAAERSPGPEAKPAAGTQSGPFPTRRTVRYPALRLIILAHYVLAALFAVGGLLTVVDLAQKDGGLPAVGVGAATVALALATVVVAELIKVVLDIEENTRSLRQVSGTPIPIPPVPADEKERPTPVDPALWKANREGS